ncbi:MAG: nucleotidyltransferase family protein [Armatimonadota bacterium]
MQTAAVILAGGKIEEDLAGHTRIKSKAFINIESKYLVEYVIDALKESPYVSRIVLVSDKDSTPKFLRDKVDINVDGGGTMIDSLLNGLKEVDDWPKVLVVPCDMPIISKDSVKEFLDKAGVKPAQIIYGIVKKEDYIKKFPGMTRTYLSLKDGVFCGTGFFLLEPRAVRKIKSGLDEVARLRKTPWKLITSLGIKTIFKFLTKQLSIRDLENKAYELFSVSARAVILERPESAVNVDKLDDLERVKRFFA